MDATTLSDHQLFVVSENHKLHQRIRNAATAELERRQLSEGDIQALMTEHDRLLAANKNVALAWYAKVLLVLIPCVPTFLFILHSIIASRYLPKGYQRKWREYWRYLCIGCLCWILVALVLSRCI